MENGLTLEKEAVLRKQALDTKTGKLAVGKYEELLAEEMLQRHRKERAEGKFYPVQK